MKTEIVIGDTLDFETSVPDYPNTDGWTLTFRLIPLVSGTAISFSASGTPVDDPLGYRVQVAPATTSTWTAGEYAWNSYLVKSGARVTLESGQVTLLPDPAVATAPRDNRSDARKRLDALESAYLRRCGKADAEGWTDKDKQFRYTPLPDILKMYNRVKQEVANEDAAERLANGTGFARKVQVRI